MNAKPTDMSSSATSSSSPSSSSSMRPFSRARSPLVLAGGVLIVLFGVRSVRPLIDPIFGSITLAMVAVIVAMCLRKRWSGVLFFVFPIALFASPGGREFSFNLSGVDSAFWRWHAIVGLLTMGLMCAAALQVARDRPMTSAPDVGTVLAGLLFGGAMIPALSTIYPMPIASQRLTVAERMALPRIELLNYAFDLPEPLDAPNPTFRAFVNNPTDLPHTFTSKALNVELFVPAKRWAIIELRRGRLTRTPVTVYCAIGDHRELGMQRTMEFTIK